MNRSIDLDEWWGLPKEAFLSKWYKEHYYSCSYEGVSGLFQEVSHKSIESNVQGNFGKVLELGAGNGEHQKFIKHQYSEYWLSDLSFQGKSLNEILGVNTTDLIRQKVINAESIDAPDHYFDRVLHMCLLHHLEKPESALLEMRRVLKSGALLSLYIPRDPSFFFRFLKYLRGLNSNTDYKKLKRLVDARDHCGNYYSIETLIEHTFRHDHIEAKDLPFGRFLPKLWRVYQIQISKDQIC